MPFPIPRMLDVPYPNNASWIRYVECQKSSLSLDFARPTLGWVWKVKAFYHKVMFILTLLLDICFQETEWSNKGIHERALRTVNKDHLSLIHVLLDK